MSANVPPSRGLSPDDSLPPVEPPNAGFILQLFFVPGVIVAVIVMVWLMFNWLAHKGNDREAFVQALQRNNEARWQAAFNLANELRADRGRRNPKLAGDSQLAAQLAAILDREIDGNSTDENSITLRIYLSRALGEFRVTDGVPTLVKAASTERNEDEAAVRRAALEGIAVLAANIAEAQTVPDAAGPTLQSLVDDAALRQALLDCAQDSDARTRAAAAVAMGVIGGPALVDKLHVMAEDTNADVRYNAATRLAHLGDEAAVPVLAEMLDAEDTAGVALEKNESSRPRKRLLITINALRATGQLAEHNPRADLSRLKSAVEKILASAPTPDVQIEATDILRVLKAHSSAASAESAAR
jgi:hypothetical protein